MPPSMSPPPTRGSTPLGHLRGSFCDVSPAYAGIDPDRDGPRPDVSRLPRLRGDRPVAEATFPELLMSPPPTRGSTAEVHRALLGPVVSPAYAGIDRCPASPGRAACRLPRLRGDRPAGMLVVSGVPESPPPTRGSTRGIGAQLLIQEVSPAYAGIDPGSLAAPHGIFGLPRLRGDRPRVLFFPLEMAPSPPPTRGSTPSAFVSRFRAQVSPAYAGIDRGDTVSCSDHRSLPRLRGDRPIGDQPRAHQVQSPPPTRGSTLTRHRVEVVDTVSPAYAGIDPRQELVLAARLGLPRLRGDRPEYFTTSAAGMLSPPPTRGSTPIRCCPARLASVSPAYAGIDPARPATCAR